MREKILKFIKFFSLLIVVTIPFIYLTQVKADSGWDTGYDSGGWDSGGWDSGGYDSSWDYDYGTSSSSSYHGSSEADGGIFIIMIILLILFILLANYCTKGQLLSTNVTKTDKKEVDYEQYRNYGDVSYSDINEDKLKEIMPGYTVMQLKEMVYNKFVNIQNAWMEFDYDKLRELCTDELYNTYVSQLNVLKVKKGKNIMSDFVTKFSYITDVVIENNLYVVKAILRIEFYDYVIDTTNNKVTRGTKNTKITNTYNLEFVKSVKDNKSKIDKCPNCGAKIDVVTSAECEYCGSTIVKDASDFVLSKKNKI